MKILVTRSIQAVLNAEIETCASADNLGRRHSTNWRRYNFRPLATRHGLLNLMVPLGYVGGLLGRYSAKERFVMESLGSMILAGRAKVGAAEQMAEQLCDRPLGESSLAALVAALDLEIARFINRQLEREFPLIERSRWSRSQAFAIHEA